MRNKQFIVGAAIVLGVILLVLGVALFVPRGDDSGDQAGESLFPDTSTERIDFGREDLSLGTSSLPAFLGGDDSEDAPALRAISNQPTIGAVVRIDDGGFASKDQYVRYVERTSGHILDAPLASLDPAVVLSGETMLRIGRVYWSRDAGAALMQRLDNPGTSIYSFLGTLSPASSTASSEGGGGMVFSGRHLEQGNVVSAAMSPNGREVFYVAKTNAGSVGYLEDVAQGTRRQLWSSLLTNITAAWGGATKVVVYTNQSSSAVGFVWVIDVTTGVTTLVLGNEYALAGKLNPAGDKMLYSLQETAGGLTSLRILDVTSGAVSYLPHQVSSNVEKCAWDSVQENLVYCAVPRNINTKGYLEQWQYGVLASDDVLWQINTSTGEAHQVLDPTELTGSSFDIVDLEVSPLGDFLVFRTRANDILWAARVPETLLKKESNTASSTEETL